MVALTKKEYKRFIDSFIKQPSGCWEWKKTLNNFGYGKFFYKGSYHSAHRIMIIQIIGKIPDGKVIMHECDNPKCVNPLHLKVATQSENRLDSFKKGRSSMVGNKNPRWKK